MVEWVQFAERLGVDMAFAAEAWWSDAVTPLAYLADKTSRIRIGTGIMQTTARTPVMTAMTALTLHDLTGAVSYSDWGRVVRRWSRACTASGTRKP
ncbi:MAG: hypothetical protein CMQ24_07925 [Gammaproteobacteria bacterium]|nr:hypothetical protein [Gammaproteobacteria bacterium]